MPSHGTGAHEPEKIEQPRDRMLQFFEFGHLRQELQEVSAPFFDLAHNLVEKLPMNAERTVCLRKLLEAKDCAVRARLYKNGG